MEERIFHHQQQEPGQKWMGYVTHQTLSVSHSLVQLLVFCSLEAVVDVVVPVGWVRFEQSAVLLRRSRFSPRDGWRGFTNLHTQPGVLVQDTATRIPQGRG